MIKHYTDWSPEELWLQEQMNFSAHLAIMFRYVSQFEALNYPGLSAVDFIHYTGERALPAWKSNVHGVRDMMNAILFTVLANGGRVMHARIEDDEAHATVSSLLKPEVMESYGVSQEAAALFWEKFVPIATALDIHFAWENTEEGHFQLLLVDKRVDR